MKDIFIKPNFIFPSLILSSIYLITITFLMNGNLVKDTIIGAYSLQYKANLLFALLQGMWTAMSGSGLVILIITALLTGMNLVLLFQRIIFLGSAGKLHLVVGGSSLLGIVGSGCAACGLPILALLGLSGSILYLPFRGTELSIIAVLLLLTSLYFIVKTNNEIMCKINIRASKA